MAKKSRPNGKSKGKKNMTDLSEMIRWNANFVRGLAQSVLDRAKVIRSTLKSYEPTAEIKIAKPKIKSGGKGITVQRKVKPAVASPVAAKKSRKAPAGPRKIKK